MTDELTRALAVVQAAERYLASWPEPNDAGDLDDLCAAVGLFRTGVADHDWGEWGEPWDARYSNMRLRGHQCRRCKAYRVEEIER